MDFRARQIIPIRSPDAEVRDLRAELEGLGLSTRGRVDREPGPGKREATLSA